MIAGTHALAHHVAHVQLQIGPAVAGVHRDHGEQAQPCEVAVVHGDSGTGGERLRGHRIAAAGQERRQPAQDIPAAPGGFTDPRVVGGAGGWGRGAHSIGEGGVGPADPGGEASPAAVVPPRLGAIHQITDGLGAPQPPLVQPQALAHVVVGAGLPATSGSTIARAASASSLRLRIACACASSSAAATSVAAPARFASSAPRSGSHARLAACAAASGRSGASDCPRRAVAGRRAVRRRRRSPAGPRERHQLAAGRARVAAAASGGPLRRRADARGEPRRRPSRSAPGTRPRQRVAAQAARLGNRDRLTERQQLNELALPGERPDSRPWTRSIERSAGRRLPVKPPETGLVTSWPRRRAADELADVERVAAADVGHPAQRGLLDRSGERRLDQLADLVVVERRSSMPAAASSFQSDTIASGTARRRGRWPG